MKAINFFAGQLPLLQHPGDILAPDEDAPFVFELFHVLCHYQVGFLAAQVENHVFNQQLIVGL